jgi:choice-of-anchor A domain-containing protein
MAEISDGGARTRGRHGGIGGRTANRVLLPTLSAVAILASAGLTLLPGVASASGSSCIPLGSAANYGEYGDGSNSVDGETVGAGVAYTASTSLDNSTFATAAGPTATQITMVLGTSGDSITDPVTLQNGSADYVGSLSGGTITTSQSGASANSVTTSPLNFSAADAALTSASSQFDSLTTSGTIAGTTTLTLTGTLTGTNVFNVTTTALKAATSVAISVPSGASVLVNVTGSSYSGSKQSVTLTGAAPADVLWNFEGGSVSLSKEAAWQGSVLVSDGALTVENSTVSGSLFDFGSAFLFENTVNSDLFTGCISSQPATGTPEAPLSVLLPAAGLLMGGTAFATQRRRRTRVTR